ncbi:MAG: phosphatidate cytidylyltransferase [Myxococcales bacterium]|nr:phosphatidate cytidylyltransferase [Myxococcales bacterium]
MATRIVTGLLLAAGAILLLSLGPPVGAYALIQLAALLVGDELFRIVLGAERTRERYVGTTLLAAVVALGWFAPAQALLALFVAAPILLSLVLFSPDDVETLARRAAFLVAGFYYLALPLVALVFIGAREKGPLEMLALFGAVFAGDSGAFFAGKFLGKHKLYEKISPKKTWEGAVGGAVASVGGFVLISTLGNLSYSLPVAIGLGFACGVVEQVGDLVESLFKRAAGVKDSGSILPGHGGMLDRVDGLLFAAPVLLALTGF